MQRSLLQTLIVTTGLSLGMVACTTPASVDETPMTMTGEVRPEIWPALEAPPLNPEIEARIDELLAVMTLEQKVGQVIQGDSNSLSAEDVKTYRLGSVLSGGNSAPGGEPYADVQGWLAAADAVYEASVDPEGVEVPIPSMWGIDAVHGHTNVRGGIVYPHNVGLGAARDPDLLRRIAAATAVELNVSGHDWTFAPTVAVPQNDRWGRGYEGFSEDPDVVESYAGAIVEGLQGPIGSEGFMGSDKVMSTAKHFLGDGGTTDGIDQGNADVSEEELRDIHLAGYLTAVEAGTQSVMASFSSWQGVPMHGHKGLLTDVLKDRMGFQGFVIGDWNGHALIPGCTATDCPQALNAGLDMYMAPDSWKGLYESTLEHVKSGRISMERLDDANRRILRVKLASRMFEKPKPSERALAGDLDRLGSAENRELAREAVRKSLVLLKNNNNTLPLAATSNVYVVGPGAESIAKFSGGWTLSWQGRDHSNDEFPNGESFLTALERVVGGAGGTVTFDPDGSNVPDNADVVIAVYGEDPYAEFQGDRDDVDFVPNDFDTDRLSQYRDAGLPVVSLFISGRPLWTNPEINDSDAFVAAWLPGSEPSGITDLLFQTNPSYDFTGRLSFSWPKMASQVKLNPHHDGYDPQFALGYGLSFSDDMNLDLLSEDGGSDGVSASKMEFFVQGETAHPWRLLVNGSSATLPSSVDGVTLSAIDWSQQEDGARVEFASDESVFSVGSAYPLDYTRESTGAMEIAFMARSVSGDSTISMAAGCVEIADCSGNFRDVTLSQDWEDYRIPLKCAADNGIDLANLKAPFVVKGRSGQVMDVANVRLAQQTSNPMACE